MGPGCSTLLCKTSICSTAEPKCSESESQAAAWPTALSQGAPHSQILPLPATFSQGIARVTSSRTAQRYTGHVPSPSPQPIPLAATLALCSPTIRCVHSASGPLSSEPLRAGSPRSRCTAEGAGPTDVSLISLLLLWEADPTATLVCGGEMGELHSHSLPNTLPLLAALCISFIVGDKRLKIHWAERAWEERPLGKAGPWTWMGLAQAGSRQQLHKAHQAPHGFHAATLRTRECARLQGHPHLSGTWAIVSSPEQPIAHVIAVCDSIFPIIISG